MLAKNAHFLRARAVVPVAGQPVEDGAVVIRDGRVAAVGRFDEVRAVWPEGAVTDLGEQVLLPGLINAHCHLDYTDLRGKIPPPDSFTAWIGEINAAKREMTEADYRAAIAEGFDALRRSGTTTVVNLAALPGILHGLPEPPIRTWWLPELYDLREPAEELVARAVGAIADFQLTRPGSRMRFGISPHAPFTASPELYEQCAAVARQSGWLLSTHLAESPEEAAMFREGTGALYLLLAGIGRTMDDCGGGETVFSSLVRRGLIAPGWLLAHGNELEESDFALMRATRSEGGPPWCVVHCPRSHAYFGHRAFPWQQLEAAGTLITLGTDSLASNDALDLFGEMRAAQQANPALSSELLLKAATLHPAAALGAAGELGVIAPGARADLIALPFSDGIGDAFDAIVDHRRAVEWVMMDGDLI